ncbi:MAG: hypothetical protein HKN70_08525 [Gammaproteobacteria bacterium]|nr:hypothetical protein [Gammaproteobacteria bacterium]
MLRHLMPQGFSATFSWNSRAVHLEIPDINVMVPSDTLTEEQELNRIKDGGSTGRFANWWFATRSSMN